MSPGIRRASWIAGVLVIVSVALAIAIPFFVDVNTYRGRIETEAEAILGRDVTLGTMKLTLLPIPGLSVKPLSIASDQKGDPPFLNAEALSAHARLMPLLQGKIAIASFTAHRPQLYLHRYADGHTNLPDLSGGAEKARAQEASGSAASDGGMSLAKLRIEGASLKVVDDAVVPGSTVTTVLPNVDIALDDFASDGPFRMKLSAALPPRSSGSLVVQGTVALPPSAGGPAPGESSLDMKLDKFQPSAFAPYIMWLAGIEPPLGSASGKVHLNARLASTPEGVWKTEGDGRLEGDLELRGVTVRPTAKGAKAVRAGDLDLKAQAAIKEGGNRIELSSFEAKTGKTRLEAAGTMLRGTRGSNVDVTVKPSQVMAEDLVTVAALVGVELPAGLSSKAPIGFQGKVSGPLDHPDQLSFSGQIALSGVRYADPSMGKPIEDIAGKLTFVNGTFKVSSLAARVGGTVVNGEATLRNFNAPQVTLNLSSSKASLDDLMALMTPSSPSAPAATRAQASNGGSTDLLGKAQGTGTVRIQEGSFGNFRFSRFEGDLKLANKVVTFDPVSFQLYGGTYRGALTADMRGATPRYAYRSSLAGVDAQPFLAENMGVKDLLAGRVSADLQMEGSGSGLDTIMKSLNGSGTLKVEHGWIGKLDVLKGLAKASDFLGERTLSQVSSGLAKNRTDFEQLTGNVTIAGGRATTDNLNLVSKDLSVAGKGGFTLDGNVDLDLKVLFSKELTQQMLAEGSRARYLEREGDRIVLPLTIRGPIASPTYMVDVKGIMRGAAKTEIAERILGGGKRSLGDIVGVLLGAKGTQAPEPKPSAGGEAPPTESPSGGIATPANAPPTGRALASSSDGAVQISGSKYEGGLLMPDLTLRGTFSGVGLAGADIKVVGKGERTVFEKTDAFKEIATWNAAHDPKAPAQIPFKVKVDGKKLAGAGDLTITITLRKSDGSASVGTFSEKKPGL
ncbi:MAG TPA: AsmA-like C-terminal region-containing protein [Candidatus Polarisedimenticolia bacterium]|nr:AsmA-like C-terminal region-containing protein [Candidatus Polarisedimenticolia bacterium]